MQEPTLAAMPHICGREAAEQQEVWGVCTQAEALSMRSPHQGWEPGQRQQVPCCPVHSAPPHASSTHPAPPPLTICTVRKGRRPCAVSVQNSSTTDR